MNNIELLNKTVEYGIIDLEITKQILDMNERTKFPSEAVVCLTGYRLS